MDTPPISPQTSLPIEDNDEVAESESNLVGGVVLTPTTTPPQPRRSPTVYDVATPEVIGSVRNRITFTSPSDSQLRLTAVDVCTA